METIEGKFAVVTGGGSGIGRSIALALADSGGHVCVSDIDLASAEAVAGEVRGKGVRAMAVRCDVADRAAVGALADAAFGEFGTVDILCNNAGISWRPMRTVLEATLDDWHFMMGINFWGVVHGIDAFLVRMREQPGRKHVVNTASIGGLMPMEGHAVYSAGKAAVVGMSEAMAGELAPYDIGVTILCPGPIVTNLTESTNRVRGESERVYTPVATPMIDRLKTFTMPSVDPVGPMVCRAILANQLYLHTATVPADLIADRVHTWFGSQTLNLEPAASAEAE